MILIVLNWLLIGYVAFMHGYWFRRIVNPSSDRPLFSLTLIWGLCALSVYTCVLLFFTAVEFPVLLFYVITAVLIHTRWRKEIVSQLRPLAKRMSSPFFIMVLLLLGCSLVFLSAHTSRIVDDWLYYTQTVLWYNEVGFVKGISNLLLPLGLGSSWHVLQSVFSFHFIPGVHLNDLNGFLVILFSVFCYEQWMKKPGDYFLVFVFFLGLLVSIPYVEACSPDLPVILFTLIGGCLIYQGKIYFTDLLLLSAFGFSIKLSAVALVVFPFVYLFTRRDHEVLANNRKRTIYFSVTMFCFFVLILVKNIYQTGYPFYPFHFFPVSQLDWITSRHLVQYYEQGIKAWGFADVRNLNELAFYQEMKPAEGFHVLLSRHGYKGLINKMAFITMAIYLITIVYRFVKFRDEKSNQYAVHLSLLIQLVIWFVFAPQYRFLLPVLLFQCSYIVSTFLPHFIGKRFSFNSITLLSILTFFILTLIYSYLEPPWITTPALAKKYSPEKAKTELEFSELNGHKLLVAPSAYCFDYPLPCITRQQLGLINREGLMLIRRDKDLREGFRLLRAGHIKPF